MIKTSSEFFEYSSIQSSKERIEVSQFSKAIFERKTSAQIEEGLLTCVKCSCEVVISGSLVQSLQSASQAAETTGGEILGPNMTSEAISECLTSKIFLGEHTPRPH